jgi:hypothetical protein
VTPLLLLRLGALAELEAGGVLVVIGLAMPDGLVARGSSLVARRVPSPESRVPVLPGLETDGVPEPIEPPIREVTAESRRPLALRLEPESALEETPGLARMVGLVVCVPTGGL